jgi:putative NADH-flavin reductase
MTVAIFGATGRTGRHLVEQALGAGHAVRALARDPARLDTRHERLAVIEGDVTDAARAEETVAGADAVLVALGHTKTSPHDVQTLGTRNILDAMRKHGVRRIVSLTGAGVADPNDAPKLWNRAFSVLLGRLQPEVLADAERHAALIRASDLDWVIVRVPRLTDAPGTGAYRVGYVGKGTGPSIPRADVARFMLEQLTSDAHLRDAPMVSS